MDEKIALQYIQGIKDIFLNTEVTNDKKKKISLEKGLKMAKELIEKVKNGNGQIIFIGNGGSAAVASHKALDFWRNIGIKGIVFSDYPRLTCLSNDEGYENLYQRQIKDFVDKKDILISISSSGKSKNILLATQEMKKKKGKIITFSGFSPKNPLRNLGDLNFYSPSFHYNQVETVHLILLDTILEFFKYDKR